MGGPKFLEGFSEEFVSINSFCIKNENRSI